MHLLCSNLIKVENLATALTLFWALHNLSTCSSKESSLSIFIPKIFLQHVTESFSMKIITGLIFLSLTQCEIYLDSLSYNYSEMTAFSGNYSKLSKLLKDNYFKFLEESVFDIMNKGNKSAS